MICFVICIGFTPVSQPVVTREFCKVWRETVKNELRLTQSEVNALRRKTKMDLVSIKKYARQHCQ
jgi:hypothetical protein